MADEEVPVFDASLMKKKKKKPKAAAAAAAAGGDGASADGGDGSGGSGDGERDYAYGELLGRVFKLIQENKPQASESKVIRIKPPTVFRVGTKKTMWANFMDNCKSLKRSSDHVLAYVFAELGTTGSLDSQNQLVLKGRYQPKQIESVLRHYIADYVSCKTCKSGDTHLEKENRLYFVKCGNCGSRRSVSAVNKGYQAQLSKRRTRKVQT